MKKILVLVSLIFICIIAVACQGNHIKDTVVQGSSISSTQQTDTSKAGPTNIQSPQTNSVPSPANEEKITEANAIEKVMKIISTLPKGYNLDVDHKDTVNGRNYYVVHFYEMVIDDPKTGTGHTATYGWYYVDMANGEVLEMDIASGNLVKPAGQSTVPQGEKVSYKTYVNGRFGFSIEYPDTFTNEILPENGDGKILTLPDGSAELTVSGMNNVVVWTLDSLYESLINDHNPSFKKKGDNWLTVSWTDEDKIVYQKSVVGKGSINTFIIKYPVSQKQTYDSIVEHLNSTFKTPSINEIH